jgi:hypothetical protein
MKKTQFRILYRQFLFRVVDLELLSSHAQGDASKLLGQFASLLGFAGVFCSFALLLSVNPLIPHEVAVIRYWGFQHILFATTMLAAGLFTVLSWDSTFPDRRDVMVLAPLPVRTRTLFLAKIAASAAAVGTTVLLLNGSLCFAWALMLAPPTATVFDLIFSLGVYRTIAAYGFSTIAAGAFIFGCVLCVQGLAAQLLPRRYFLRVSALLQLAAFSLLVCTYFLQPSLATPKALADPANQHALAWLPSYWFFALFQQLNGTVHAEIIPLARRAWIALGVVAAGTAAAYALCYFRTLRKIVEEPDILPGSRTGTWLPRFGNALQTAVVQFSIRTLLRSRHHRMILAFYLGVGFALIIPFLKTPATVRERAGHSMEEALLAPSIIMMAAWVVGTRVVFSLPLDLRANWTLRIAPIRGRLACLSARRRALLALAVAPAWIASASLFLSIWPWPQAIGHLVLLGLFAVLLAEVCLFGTQKLPFTCSYLPGRSNFHLTFWLCIGLVWGIVIKTAEFEREALRNGRAYAIAILFLVVALGLARWRTSAEADSEDGEVQFEETVPPVILRLGLGRDGA